MLRAPIGYPERSKIGMAYLHALEGELFAKLPAPVYVRGFLAEYARALALDGERVKQTYLARYRAARGPAVDDEDEARPAEGMVRLTPGVRDVRNELSYPRTQP